MKLNGPQSDRDRKWSLKDNLTTRVDNSSDDELSRLKNENAALKDQVKRSIKELQIYQLRFPSPHSTDFNANLNEEDDDNFNWSPSSERLQPLFQAYDIRIAELEDSNRKHSSVIDNFKQNLEILVRENEDLRSTLSTGGIHKNISSNLDPTTPLHAEIIAELQEQVDILRGENNLLMEQRGVIMVELEQHQSELKRKTLEITQQGQQLMSTINEIKILTIRATEAEKDRELAANQALSYSEAIGKAELEQEQLCEQISILKQKCKDLDGLVAEYKKQLRSVSAKSEDDNNSTFTRVLDAEQRVRELHTLLLTKTQELESANELNRKLRSEYQNTRQDAEGMLQVMTGLERQLNEYASREADVEKQFRISKEKEEETMIFREQCNARDEQNKREIDRLLNERKLILLRRKDELDKAIEQGRKVMSDQIICFERDMDTLSEKNAKLIFEAEKAVRDSRSIKEQYDKMHRFHEEEQKSIQIAQKDLTEKLENISRLKEQETIKRIESQDQCKDLRSVIEKMRNQLEDIRSQFSQSERVHETSSSALKNQIREFQKDLSEKTNTLNRKSKELEELKENMQTKISYLERKYQDEISQYQRQATEASRFALELESANETIDRRSQSTIAQLKEKYVLAMTHLESKMRTESETVKVLSIKIRNAELTISDLLEEKSNIMRIIEVTQSELRIQDEDLAACRSTISDLTHQLASSHQAREESAVRAAKMIEEMNLQSSSPTRRSFEEHKDKGGIDDILYKGMNSIRGSPNPYNRRSSSDGINLRSIDSLGSYT